MSPPTKFAHVVFSTHRYEEMIEFYTVLFRSRISVRSDSVCFMTYDDEHHRHAIANLGPPAGPETARRRDPVGVAHLAYTWPDLESLLTVYRRARDELGVSPRRCLRHGPTLSMYYLDPDGNRLELQMDLMSPEEATEFMSSEAFARNPAGEDFDPEALLARFESGEPVGDLVLRSDQPVRPVSVRRAVGSTLEG